MKTLYPPHNYASFNLFLLGSALCLAVTPTLTAVEADPDRPYQLFVGVDLEVPWRDGHLPVRRVFNRNRGVEILKDGELHRVKLDASNNLHLKRQLKVGAGTAQITGLAAERCYSPHTDPWRKWVDTSILLNSQQDMQMQVAHGAMLESDREVGVAGLVLRNALPEHKAQAEAAYQAAAARQGQVMSSFSSTATLALSDSLMASSRINNEKDKQLFDAIEVIFDLSSDQPVAEAYVVLLADYHVPGRTENYRLICAQSIGAIDSRPQRVRIWSDGLPTGYELMDTKVHLYSYGSEIPTNQSEKAVAVSEDQAWQILLASHLQQHRQQSVPAEPLWQTAPVDFRARLDPSQLPERLQLDIDAAGRVAAVRDGEGGAVTVRGLAHQVLTRTRYLPALEAGTPVASTLSIESAHFFR